MRDKAGAAHGQQGMASIVVVSVLVIILTLISIGFARLVSRTVTNSANRQFSASATYAAQSAINDVAGYLKQYVQQYEADHSGAAPDFLPKSTK
jgi:Tfp pilus assembly protein PilX